MAVKQNPEATESSAANGGATTSTTSNVIQGEQNRGNSDANMEHGDMQKPPLDNSSNDVCDGSSPELTKLLSIIECIELRRQNGRVGFDMMLFYQAIINELARINVTRSVDLKRFKEDILKIGEFFANAKEKLAYRFFLKIVCQIMTNETNGPPPSCAVAVILQLFKDENVYDTVNELLDQCISTDQIRRAVTCLSNWMRVCNFCENLNLWIIAIMNGLYEQGKHSLFVLVALDTIEMHFHSLILPMLRPKVMKILFLLLEPLYCTVDVFHKIVPKFSIVANNLKKQVKDFPDVLDLLQRLTIAVSILMSRFSGFDELYAPMRVTVKDLVTTFGFKVDEVKTAKIRKDFLKYVPARNNAKVGLVNLGNTCYVNSIFQALVLTKDFCREILLSNSQSPIIIKMQQFLVLMLYSTRNEINPVHLLNAVRPPGFTPGVQQDSSEFLSYLLETVHQQEMAYEQLKTHQLMRRIEDEPLSSYGAHGDSPSNSAQLFMSIVDKTFTGKIATTYTCLTCRGKNSSVDTFRDLQLSFPDMNSDSNVNYFVQDLLDFFCNTEKLYGDNQYFCSLCKKHSDGERSIKFISAPKNLILTIKHFKYDQNYHMRTKLQNKVSPDEKISIKMFRGDKRNEVVSIHYDLYTSIVHSGVSVDSGHYYAYGSDFVNNWYKFNDSIVTKSNLKDLHELSPPNTPYILFYKMSATSVKSINSDELTKLTKVDVPAPPKMNELPRHLRDFVNQDNYLYLDEFDNDPFKATAFNNYKIHTDREEEEEEDTEEDEKKTEIFSNSAADNLKKFLNDNHEDDDDDEQPPTSCGTNALKNNMNLFIF
ncbi:ubiquitin carboxyl-terminal hydrolase 38-like [Teleopsis dalmanni]|uniref:ubiquitin carboxyl-terminal hydrolase 38-like n=1 Tax=Teleopsis dalmanni TaxID=139649 RepID=UPI0018CDF77F|nr:ubiquitin carboxyl-terminal hydrolase 38-like [Teleopsis dalmanni]XP_037954348.1 ubiquitin carboxyl-terminal hydrolase 38-like [Teleopsis dalmanni]